MIGIAETNKASNRNIWRQLQLLNRQAYSRHIALKNILQFLGCDMWHSEVLEKFQKKNLLTRAGCELLAFCKLKEIRNLLGLYTKKETGWQRRVFKPLKNKGGKEITITSEQLQYSTHHGLETHLLSNQVLTFPPIQANTEAGWARLSVWARKNIA